jgi:hypothetical protein
MGLAERFFDSQCMTTTVSAARPLVRHVRHVRHHIEMLAAMLVGMELLGSLWTPGRFGWLWSVATMAVPMAVWMRYRGYGWVSAKRGNPSTNPVIRALGDRWPTWVALAVSFDFWHAPFVPPVWTLLLCQSAYLFWGRRAPRVQLVVFGLYAALAALVIMVSPDAGVLLIAFGWGAHAVWDLVHHVRNAVVPRWWSEWCGMFDLVIAVTILLMWF